MALSLGHQQQLLCQPTIVLPTPSTAHSLSSYTSIFQGMSKLACVFLMLTGLSTVSNAFTEPVVPSRPNRRCVSWDALAVASRSDSREGGRQRPRKKPKPRQKLLRTTVKHQGAPRVSARPPPNLTLYDVHTNPALNLQRQKDSIGCEHFGKCSGCLLDANIGVDTPILKSAALYFSSTAVRQHRTDVKRNGLPLSVESPDDGWFQVVVPSSVTHWRTQAKLAVAPASSSWTSDGCRLGLYQRKSHDVMPIPNCQVHHQSINKAVQIIEECTAKVGTAAFSENTREGGLRYVQLQVERSTGKICLTLVWHAEQLKQAQPALSRLVKALQKHDKADNLWHSIWCHCNDGVGNNIFHRHPRRWHRLFGPEYLREPLPCTDNSDTAAGWLYFTPLTFRQGNMDGFSVLAADVARVVPAGAKVCELYGGVGVLGLTTLAHHANQNTQPLAWLRCSDENPANPRCFQRAVESLPTHVTSNTPSTADSTVPDTEGMTLSQLAELMERGEDPFPESQPLGPKTSFMVASAASALRAGQALGANVLIVDPPRKGLEDAVLDELCKPFNPNQPYVESASLLSMDDNRVNWANDVRTLIYVSCGFDALAKDTERLLTSRSGWELESATGYILFPGSDHVETVCIFQRS